MEYITITVELMTCLITMGGVWFAFFKFKDEINKKKADINLNKLSEAPLKIVKAYDCIMQNMGVENMGVENKRKLFETVNDMMANVLAYGSTEAIRIVSTMQQNIYARNENQNSVSSEKIMGYYAILFSQVKYDLTGVEISPEEWYKIKITDYKINKEKFIEANNLIVNELNLHSFLLID